MGSPVSPITANAFMEHFEEKALSSFRNPPRFWGRYVDDTMVVIKKTDVHDFTKHINSVHDAIKFTVEEESDNCIPMLDTMITRNPNGCLSFGVYRKPTHTDQYLDFASHQPLEHKLGVIRTLTHRAKTICSDQDTLNTELHHVKRALSVCGYTKWAWNTPQSRKLDPKPNARKDTAPPKGHITLPYVQG
ncbi:uncharacterized protein [Amphiura filiformis]|uniref:uncharacterized protein n=1 Tax=Amphiura filiformis TaxID=82378 RepID=UPI003B20DF92